MNMKENKLPQRKSPEYNEESTNTTVGTRHAVSANDELKIYDNGHNVPSPNRSPKMNMKENKLPQRKSPEYNEESTNDSRDTACRVRR